MTTEQLRVLEEAWNKACVDAYRRFVDNTRGVTMQPATPAPEPPSVPEEPVIEQERWARKGECGWWLGQPDGEPPHRDAEPVKVIVRSAAADEALREKAASGLGSKLHQANQEYAVMVESLQKQVSALTRERDEVKLRFNSLVEAVRSALPNQY